MNVRTGSLKAFRYICCMYTISILYCVCVSSVNYVQHFIKIVSTKRTVHFPNRSPEKKSLKYLTIFTFRFACQKKRKKTIVKAHEVNFLTQFIFKPQELNGKQRRRWGKRNKKKRESQLMRKCRKFWFTFHETSSFLFDWHQSRSGPKG